MAEELSQANINALNAGNRINADLTLSKVITPTETSIEINSDSKDDGIDRYNGINWKRLPNLMKPHHSLLRTPSWIYKYRYRLQSRVNNKQIIFICKYCHIHRIIDCGGQGRYDITRATSAAAAHLRQNKKGHGVDKHGKITTATEARQSTLLEQVIRSGHHVSQAVANALIGGFDAEAFKQSAVNWITKNNHPLREFETPAFRKMLQLANPKAKRVLWKNHQAVADFVMTEFKAYIPSVKEFLSTAQLRIHVSFNGWSTPNGRYALTGIWVHHLNRKGKIRDYIIALPTQLGRHFGENYAEVIGGVLNKFNITKERLGYFVVDNESKNNTAVEGLAIKFNFIASHRHGRYAYHILNLVAQQIIWSKDKDSFKNDENIPEEEKFLTEWRKEGALGALCDLIVSINTAQQIKLFESFQITQNVPPDLNFKVKQLVKPVKTR